MLRTIDDVIRGAHRAAKSAPEHHWVFDHFSPRSHLERAGHQTGYLGETFPGRFVQGARVADADWLLAPAFPVIEAEYYQLTDLLEAALDAKGVFTFIEAGAGYGRWSARAALAARRIGKAAHVVMIEGDPVHAQWAREMMALNRVDDFDVIEAALGAEHGKALFIIDVPEGFFRAEARTSPAEWYGQSLVASTGFRTSSFAVQGDDVRYGGQPVHAAGDWHAIEVETVTLAAVLADLGHVDLIDFDVQGAEGAVIAASLPLLNEKVRRLHIETHSVDIERGLRRLLPDAGWICLRDLPLSSTMQTPFGQIAMAGGGLQSWINPLLY
jgi:FkbM family methyltransferase